MHVSERCGFRRHAWWKTPEHVDGVTTCPWQPCRAPAGLATVTCSRGAAGVRVPGSVRWPQARFPLSLCAENLRSDFERITWLFSFSVCKVQVAQLCPTLCDPTDYTVHGILQARILEWGAFPFSRGSSQHRDWTQVSGIAGGFFTCWATQRLKGPAPVPGSGLHVVELRLLPVPFPYPLFTQGGWWGFPLGCV